MDGKQFHLRLRAILALFLALLVAFTWVLYDLQVVHGAEYAAQSRRKISQTETVDAVRGRLMDCYGRVLVDNLPSYNVTINTAFMGEEKNDILLRLVELCRDYGVVWADTLPLSSAPPFAFTLASASGGSANNYRKFTDKLSNPAFTLPKQLVDDMDFSSYRADPAALMDALRTEFQLDPALSDGDARAVIGIRYELYLRAKEISRVAYIFAENVTIDFITAVKEAKLTGVEFTTTTVRQYHTPYAAHILGRVGLMDGTEWDTYGPLGYPFNASVGKDGVEKAFEAQLHGVAGVKAVETNTAGKVVSESWLTDPLTGRELLPQPGGNVMLTMDEKLQGAVERSLATRIPQLPSKESKGGAAVVIDVTDGGVLAMASYPSYDITQYGALFNQLKSDPLTPLLNRATMEIYPPGSTFKMVTAAGALEEGIITPQTRITDTGRYTYYKNKSDQPQCWIYRTTGGTHGTINVTTAIEKSCNVFFYDTGRRLGISELERYARMFGLGEKTGIEIPETRGVVAGPAYTESLGQKWYEGNVMYAAIGQENNKFTPLQLANYVATLVNGGTHYSAHLLKSVKSNDFSTVLYEQAPEALDTLDLDPQNLEAIKAGMLKVAQGSRYFKDLPVRVGAKTGSAQVSAASESNAIYVAFAPYENPKIALAIVVEKGGSGAELGGIADDILEQYFTASGTLEAPEQENTLQR